MFSSSQRASKSRESKRCNNTHILIADEQWATDTIEIGMNERRSFKSLPPTPNLLNGEWDFISVESDYYNCGYEVPSYLMWLCHVNIHFHRTSHSTT